MKKLLYDQSCILFLGTHGPLDPKAYRTHTDPLKEPLGTLKTDPCSRYMEPLGFVVSHGLRDRSVLGSRV